MDIDDSIDITIAKCFSQYKNSVFKIGLDEAYTQYATLYQDLNEHRWKLDVLRELYYIQFTVAKCRNQEQAGRQIRANVNLLGDSGWIQEHTIDIVSMLDWFDDLEQKDQFNQRQGSLQDVMEGFVYLTTRRELIECIIKHDPISVPEVLDRLLLSAGRLISRHQLHISEMLYTVIEEDPQYATWIRYQLLERELLPELIVRITVTFCNDEIVFLNGVFCGFPSWFMVQSANSISHFMKVKGRIFNEIQRSTTEDDTVQLAMAIRALAGLVGYLGIKLNDIEIGKCLELLRTSKTERIVKLLLSLMLLSSEHAIRSQRTLAGVLSQLLQTGVSEMPMLLMVYFQTDQFGQIETMARSILDMNVAIPKLALFEMQKLFRSIDTN